MLITLISMASITAQAAVIDVPHIVETVHNGYKLYQSVENAIEQTKYAYETAKAQIDNMRMLDLSNLEPWQWPQAAVSWADQQIDFVRRTENQLKSIGVTVNGKKIPLSQIYRLPGEALDGLVDDLTRDMSEWEKQRAWSRLGLHPANYRYVKELTKRAEATRAQIAVIDEVIKENQAKEKERIDKLVAEANENPSQTGMNQVIMALLQAMIGEQQEANRLNALAQKKLEEERLLREGAQITSNDMSFTGDWFADEAPDYVNTWAQPYTPYE